MLYHGHKKIVIELSKQEKNELNRAIIISEKIYRKEKIENNLNLIIKENRIKSNFSKSEFESFYNLFKESKLNLSNQNQKIIEFGNSVESSLSNLSSVPEDLQTLLYRVEQLDEDLQSIENLTLENERLFNKAQLQVATRPKTKQATIVDPLKDFIYLGNFSMNQMTHVVLATPSGKKYFQLGDMPIPLLRIHQIQDDLIILIDALGKPHILLRERSPQ